MTPSSQAEKAQRLRALHVPGDPLVVVNAWDAASARTVAALEACKAIATASWSIAAAHGVPDGEALSRDEMIAAGQTKLKMKMSRKLRKALAHAHKVKLQILVTVTDAAGNASSKTLRVTLKR